MQHWLEIIAGFCLLSLHTITYMWEKRYMYMCVIIYIIICIIQSMCICVSNRCSIWVIEKDKTYSLDSVLWLRADFFLLYWMIWATDCQRKLDSGVQWGCLIYIHTSPHIHARTQICSPTHLQSHHPNIHTHRQIHTHTRSRTSWEVERSGDRVTKTKMPVSLWRLCSRRLVSLHILPFLSLLSSVVLLTTW